MKKEDFKIEIIEQKYANGNIKFVPNIFIRNKKFTDMSSIGKFCNNLRSHTDWFKVKEFMKCQITNYTNPVTIMTASYSQYDTLFLDTKEQAIELANLAIDTYLTELFNSTVIETKIHKV